jgi:hypothetical protein
VAWGRSRFGSWLVLAATMTGSQVERAHFRPGNIHDACGSMRDSEDYAGYRTAVGQLMAAEDPMGLREPVGALSVGVRAVCGATATGGPRQQKLDELAEHLDAAPRADGKCGPRNLRWAALTGGNEHAPPRKSQQHVRGPSARPTVATGGHLRRRGAIYGANYRAKE